jgi:anti-sigma factor RsiW
MKMNCDLFQELSSRDRLTPEEDSLLARHLSGCPACTSCAAEDAALSDALVEAAAAVSRFRRLRRRSTSLLVAASVILSAAVAIRSAVAPPRTVYVIRGDSTGVVLTGPGVARRAERVPAPVPARKGDRA